MQFDTQRLRVQIPCGGTGSVVNTADFCGEGNHRSFFTPPEEPAACRPGTWHVPEVACGLGSDIFRTAPWEELLNPEYVTQRIVLEPEDLPRLREQLELKLKMLSMVADATAAARRQIKANLSDIDASEKALRNPSNG